MRFHLTIFASWLLWSVAGISCGYFLHWITAINQHQRDVLFILWPIAGVIVVTKITWDALRNQ